MAAPSWPRWLVSSRYCSWPSASAIDGDVVVAERTGDGGSESRSVPSSRRQCSRSYQTCSSSWSLGAGTGSSTAVAVAAERTRG